MNLIKSSKFFDQIYEAIKNNDLDKVHSILKQAQEEKFDINEKNRERNYLFLWAVVNGNIDIIKAIINYANKNNIILNITDKDNDGDDPLMYAINGNQNEIFKLILDYATEKKLI